MTFRADDLVPVIPQPSIPDVGFRQGTVISWDTNTGSNTIVVGGSILSNVPVLNTGEAIALRSGHNVGLLRFQTQYFILGRITLPGDIDFASTAVEFASGYNESDSWNITTTPTVRATVTFTVPTWADQALVWASSTAMGINTKSPAATDYLVVKTRIAGDDGFAMYGSAETIRLANATAVYTRVFTPGSTITVQTLVSANGGTWTAGASGTPANLNLADITAVAVFRNVL